MLNRSFGVFLCILFVHSQTKDNLINRCNDDLSCFRTGDDMMTGPICSGDIKGSRKNMIHDNIHASYLHASLCNSVEIRRMSS